MRDATSRGQWMCMALRSRGDQKGCPQPALQSLENQSRFLAFWLIKKEVGYCWRIYFRVLAVLFLASISPSFFAFQAGMWDTPIAALLNSPTVSEVVLDQMSG